ncbi:MAG TPA: DUF234 domain-containing protein, partial [Candidatus Dormibacteraeota bacterium]|nr:DUF234 domain-containing protein [Candidatus Dormibacteraeota bacterium]
PATEYELVDTYLGFWFRVLYPHIPDIEAGSGARELRRANAAWARHLGCTFQGAARAHAERMAASGQLPSDLVVGRWWSPTVRDARVDVLGLRAGRPYLVGEARWGEGPLGLGDLTDLRARLQRLPSPVAEPVLVLWGRKGVAPEVRGHALGFDVAAAIGE